MGSTTRISCSTEVRDLIRAAKYPSETYNDILSRLIEADAEYSHPRADDFGIDHFDARIPCGEDTHKRLREEKWSGETYNDTILRLLVRDGALERARNVLKQAPNTDTETVCIDSQA